MSTILRVFSYLKRYPALAAAQLFCAIVMTLLVVVFPSATGHVIDKIIPSGDTQAFLFWVGIALAAYFGKDFLNSLRIILNNHFEQKVIYDLRSDLYQKIQRLPLKWFDNKRTGDIMTRVIEDVTALERVLIDGIEQGLIAVLQVLVVGYVLYSTDFSVALWATAPIPLLAIGAWLYSRNAGGRYKAQREAVSDMNALLHDNISGIRQIKAYAIERGELARFNVFSLANTKATLRVMYYWAIYSPTMSFVSMLGYVLVLGFGGWAVMKGEMQKGELTKFFLLLTLFYEPIGRLHQLNQMVLSARAAGDRVFEIMDSEEEQGIDTGKSLPQPIKGEVVFDNVSFAYGSQPTLNKVSLYAAAGETIALVGSTGAGKSTVLSLLNRFYEHDSGSIRIDGTDITELSKTSLRESFGYVTQEAFLFNDSVRANLIIAQRDATDDDMWAALRNANAEEFVRKLPQGLDTNVGERGVKLSGGEKQRLSIARALLKNPPLLLLDEATASVDSQTERLIQEALDRLMVNRTTFVIAHRLSTIRNAHRIYVLEGGEVIEIGNHEQLLAKQGRYAQLSRISQGSENLTIAQ